MPSHVQRCLSITPRPNGGHRETKPAVPESPDDCFGRLQFPPGIPHAPVAEALHDRFSAAPRSSTRFRIRFELQRRPVATELRTHYANGLVHLPPAPARAAACGLDKLRRVR